MRTSVSIPPDSGFLTVAQVAERLALSPHFVYRLVREGRIACHRFGRRVRFTDDQIADYIDRCRVPAAASEPNVSELQKKHLGL